MLICQHARMLIGALPGDCLVVVSISIIVHIEGGRVPTGLIKEKSAVSVRIEYPALRPHVYQSSASTISPIQHHFIP